MALEGRRGGEPFTIELAPGRWGLEARPRLPAAETSLYLEARSHLAAGGLEAGLALLRQLATKLQRVGRLPDAAWMSFETAEVLRQQQRWGEASAAIQAGLADAEAGGEARLLARGNERFAAFLAARGDLQGAAERYRQALALHEAIPASVAAAEILNCLGRLAIDQGSFEEARRHLERALAIGRGHAPGSLVVAETRSQLAVIFGIRSDFDAAMDHMRGALEIQERLAPLSPDVVQTLSRLGLASRRMGRLAEAEAHYRRALEIQQRLEPDGHGTARVLINLGALAMRRGRLARAEELFWRSFEIFKALSPESLEVAGCYSNLGGVLELRGNLEAAQRYHHRALELVERLAPENLNLGIIFDSLGGLALRRGDPAVARRHFERALAVRERVAPGSVSVARSLRDLGRAAAAAGRLEDARRLLERALAIQRRVAPGGLELAHTLDRLGEVAARRQQLADAESYHREALAVHRRLAPGTLAEAVSCQRLAAICRRLGRGEEARQLYALATAALEAQEHRVGGSYEDRAGFAASRASLYAESIDLLVEQGRLAEAFEVLERSRSRAFLELLGRRDLSFAADVPAQLEERRRGADERYDRVLGQLARLSGEAPEARGEALRAELREARRRQQEVKAQIRAISPRLSALRDPEPLDLQATRELLAPGTVLLAYSLGEAGGHLFAVGHGEEEIRVFPVAAGLAALRDEVARLRALLRPGESIDAIRFRALRLGELLLAPAASSITGAQRLLILPQGPLHALPFAALALPAEAGEPRYLVELGPVAVAASATVFAELVGRRRDRGEIRLSAFGDPLYPGSETPAEQRGPALRAVLELGLRLDPLPASRAEVESLGKLFPERSEVFFGADASEENAKAAARSSNALHFACHAVVDDRFPLESALVLSLPAAPRDGRENGLLQAWEIFEQMRIDADLVTLSACDTGLGKELAGEGMIGLTRAFQYAGARSVLASLWAVNDASTARLMQRFYGELKRGAAKDAALREAQLALIRGGGESSHPFHWAAFQLAGDWR